MQVCFKEEEGSLFSSHVMFGLANEHVTVSPPLPLGSFNKTNQISSNGVVM